VHLNAFQNLGVFVLGFVAFEFTSLNVAIKASTVSGWQSRILEGYNVPAF
jgi:hypothetical protein